MLRIPESNWASCGLLDTGKSAKQIGDRGDNMWYGTGCASRHNESRSYPTLGKTH